MKSSSLTKTLAALCALTLLAGCDFIPSSYDYTDKAGNKKTIYLTQYTELANCALGSVTAECKQAHELADPYLNSSKATAEEAKKVLAEAKAQLACMKKHKSNSACGVTDPSIAEGDIGAMEQKIITLQDTVNAANFNYFMTAFPLARIPQYIMLDTTEIYCTKGDQYNSEQCNPSDTRVKIDIPLAAKNDPTVLATWVKEQVDKYACRVLDIVCVNGKPVTTTDTKPDNGLGDAGPDPFTVIQQFIDQNNQNSVNGPVDSGYNIP